MKNFVANSRLGLAFVLSALFTASMSLMVQVASADEATSKSAERPGATITRYPVKMRMLRGTVRPEYFNKAKQASKSAQ